MGDMMTPFMTIGIAYFVRNNIDAENPEQIFYVKCVYFLSLLVTWCLLAYMYFQSSRIGSSTERGKELKVKQMNTQTGKEEEVTMTQEAYDFSKIKGAFGQSFMGLCIMGFLHWKWAVVTPMAIQSIVQPMLFLKSPLASVYLFGNQIPRPFDEKKQNPFGDMMEQYKETTKKIEEEKKKKYNTKEKKLTGSQKRQQNRDKLK